jgi:uncharacterized protein YkwD
MQPAGTDLPLLDAATLCLVNQLRTAHRLHSLRGNYQLASVAERQVRQMVALDYFADVGPGGQTPLALVAASRYPAAAATFTVGQNLAWGTGTYTTPARIVAAWMASPPHRAIILEGQFRDAGVAVIPSAPAVVTGSATITGATYAMEFGVRY